MKGIILAGGKGTRLQPATLVMNKHMVPIINKPMILYPLETLKAFGIQDVLIVSGGNHLGAFADFLGDGSGYGMSLTYRVQREAGGIAQALGLARNFAGASDILVVLGDNIFDNEALISSVNMMSHDMACIFLSKVDDPERFGVATVEYNHVIEIEEKPQVPKSDLAVTGLYHYPNDVFKVVRDLKPSARGELEITDVNNYYLDVARMEYVRYDGFWSDAGTVDSLAKVTQWAYERGRIATTA